MMQELARLTESATGQAFDAKKHRLRCLAHIINLATQALLTAHSKSKHYDPATPNAELVVERRADDTRDEVGLVRAIAIKVRVHIKRINTYNSNLFLGALFCTAQGTLSASPDEH